MFGFNRSSYAQTTYTWNGSVDNTWANTANWGPVLAPPFLSLDTALFNLAGTTPITTDLGTAALNLGQVQITSGTTLVTIGAGTGGSLVLSGVAGVGIDMSTASRGLTISSPVTLAAAQQWNVNSGQRLLVSGNIGLGGNALTLNQGSSGTVALGGVGASISGAGGLNINGGTAFLSNVNTYTGQTIISSGALAVAGSTSAFGAIGVGNEIIVNSGGTLNVGGQSAVAGKIINIAGTGVGGIGAIINTGAFNQLALQGFNLTADATLAVGHGLVPGTRLNPLINAQLSRIDSRIATYSATANIVNLGGNTLTIGTSTAGGYFGFVNANINGAGNIVVNNGMASIELGTTFDTPTSGTITVNPNAILSFWGFTGTNSKNVVLNGGILGDFGSSASQTIPANVTIGAGGGFNPTLWGNANTTTISGLLSSGGTAGVEIAKRGGGIIALNNQANSFTQPLNVYQGSIQGTYTTALPTGLTPQNLTGTPLGTAPDMRLSGGALLLRFDGQSNTTNQVASISKVLTLDRAANTINLDRVSGTGTDKNVFFSNTQLVFAPPSAANGFSIGQQQLTMVQNNGYRTQLGGFTMSGDTVFNVGDFTLTDAAGAATASGGVTGGFSLVKIGVNSIGFVGGTHSFNSLYHLGGNLAVGQMFGTGLTSTTVTAGTGPIILGANSIASFRSTTSFATNQTIELRSNNINPPVLQLENRGTAPAIPAGFRALGGGTLSMAGGTYNLPIDFARLGEGTFTLGTNAAPSVSGAGSATFSGNILPGAGNTVRLGYVNGGTLTFNTANVIGGAGSTAALSVGEPLVNGAVLTTNGLGRVATALFSASNNYSGGTTVNRGSTIRLQVGGTNAALGTGVIDNFGTLTAEGANGTFFRDATNMYTINSYGGSTIRLDNSSLTTAVDINRWDNSTAIALKNSGLELTNRNNNTNTTEQVGPISFSGGSTIFVNRVNNVATAEIQLTGTSLTRVGQGTLEVQRAGNSGFGGTTKYVFSTAPTLVNGVVPGLFLQDATNFTLFANYNASGIVPQVFSNTITTGSTPGTFDTGLTAGTAQVRVDFAAANTTLTLGDDPILQAIKIGGGTGATTIATSGANDTITIRSGHMIVSGHGGGFSNDGTRTVNLQPNLVFNDGSADIEGVVFVRNAFTTNLTGSVTAGSFTKAGTGNLHFNTAAGGNIASSIPGTFAINQGTVLAFGATSSSSLNLLGSGNILLQGGQLSLRSNNSAVTGTINTTMANSITLGQDIPFATIDVNRSGADSASTGTFIFNPTASGPGLVLQGSPGVQGQTLNVSGGTYGLQFGNNAQNSFASNLTINTAVTVTLNNGLAPTANGFTLTKSGGGQLTLATNTTPTTSFVTNVVVNNGTLQLNNPQAFGTSTASTITMNAGTLNLRRDAAATFLPVVVNGNSTISVNQIGANTNVALTIPSLTVNGAPTLTVSSGNGFNATIPSLILNGSPILNPTMGPGDRETAVRLSNAVTGGALIRVGPGHLHFNSSTAGSYTYDGGTYMLGGITRVRTGNALGTGSVVLGAGATIDFDRAYTFTAAQPLNVRSTPAFLSMISMNQNFAHPTANVDTTHASVGIIGLSNLGIATNYNTTINMGSLYGGNWYLGAMSSASYDGRYSATSLGVGAGNTYRFGGGGGQLQIAMDNSGAAINNVLSGATSNAQFGFDSGNILPSTATTFAVTIGGTNDFGSGSTTNVIHRGMAVRLASAGLATHSSLGQGSIDVFGSLQLISGGTLRQAATQIPTNALTLHPGSSLLLDNSNGITTPLGASFQDRISNTTALALNGALLDLLGNNNSATSVEAIGDVTISRGARIRVVRNNGNAANNLQLTMANLNGLNTVGNSLMLQPSANNSLGVASSYDRIVVAGTAPTVTNGMVDPRIVNATSGQFVTYSATNGFVDVVNDNIIDTVGGPVTTLLGNVPTNKVNFQSTGTSPFSPVILGDNLTAYVLRANVSVNNGGPFNTITLRGGGLANFFNTVNLQPNIVFDDGTSNIEGRIYVGTNANMTLQGQITASAITKFGNGPLTIVNAQPNLTAPWVVNSGELFINDFNALGSGTVTLNATQTTGGNAAQTLNGSRLVYNRDIGSTDLQTFQGGTISIVNEGTIRVNQGGANDRQYVIPGIATTSTSTLSSAALTFDVPNFRVRATTPSLTLNNDTTLRVVDAGSTADYGRIAALSVDSLVGSNRTLTKIGNRTLELGTDNATTFTGGAINVNQGTVRVRHNGALGSSTTAVTINPLAALEIATSNFAPTATITQLNGSSERWNVQDARGTGTYNLPAGVNLQLNTNLANTQTIGLNGGTIEGFLYSDHPAQVVDRVMVSTVTVNLLNHSLVGQNALLGPNYDTGRGPTVFQPFNVNQGITGATLRIEGAITASSFDITKTGFDTVVLGAAGSPANTYRNTIIEGGMLRINRNNALPTSGLLAPKLAGVFDLFGNDQTIGGLGYIGVTAPSGMGFLNASGQILNSAYDFKTLNINNSTDTTYNGTIDRTVNILKTAVGTQTLGSGNNSYIGSTTINDGVLSVGTLANGGLNSSIGASTNAATNLVFGGGTLRYTGGNVSTDRNFTLNAGGGTWDVSTAATNLTLAGVGNGVGTLTKAGSGTATLTGVNTYTGNTIVSAGTLALSGSGSFATSPLITVGTSAGSTAVLNASGLTSGANFAGGSFTLASGQTLAGHGTVTSTNGLSVPSGRTVAPGTSSGTITINANVVIAGNYNFELSTSGSSATLETGGSSVALPHTNHDVIVINGTADLNGMTVNIASLGTTGFDFNLPYSWRILTATAITGAPVRGSISGSEFTTVGPNASYYLSIDTASSPHALYLNFNPVPEPGTIFSVSLLVAGLGYGARRRRLM
ncbi:MAG: beta strand repeat-containing protein [Fimbriiglobus sp.]